MPNPVPEPRADRGTTATREVAGVLVDGAAGGDHPASLYDFDGLAQTVPSLEAIGEGEMARYREDGYIAVESAFPREVIDGAVSALEGQILGETGSAQPTQVQFESWAAEEVEALDSSKRLLAARKLTRFVDSDPRLARLARDPEMLEVVSRLMGGATPVLLQEMALLKPPGGREKPWHQDRAYFNVHPDNPIVGVWIALDEATPENGCMRLWVGRHQDGPVTHFQRRDWQICDRDIGRAGRVAAPFRPGGLLFFDPLLPHGTPRNDTASRRWAIQFHFHPEDAVITGDEDRLKVFGPEGKNVEC